MSGIDLSDLPTSYTLTFEGGPANQPIDIHLDDIKLDLTGDVTKPVSADVILDVKGDPAHPVALDLTGDPNKPIAVNLSLTGRRDEPITVDLGLDNVNVCLSLAVTQLPRARIHVPTKYEFGLCLFGRRIFDFNIAGETMIIMEDNPPRIIHQASARVPNQPPQEPGETSFRVTLGEDDEVPAEGVVSQG
jgi:hypothetical protein